MYLSALPKKLIVGRNRPLQCESFPTFGGKPAIRDGPAKSNIDIVERLGGIGRGIYIAIKIETLFMEGLCLWLTKHAVSLVSRNCERRNQNGKQPDGKCYR